MNENNVKKIKHVDDLRLWLDKNQRPLVLRMKKAGFWLKIRDWRALFFGQTDDMVDFDFDAMHKLSMIIDTMEQHVSLLVDLAGDLRDPPPPLERKPYVHISKIEKIKALRKRLEKKGGHGS